MELITSGMILDWIVRAIVIAFILDVLDVWQYATGISPIVSLLPGVGPLAGAATGALGGLFAKPRRP